MTAPSPAAVNKGKVTVTNFSLSYDTLEGPVEAVSDTSIRVDPGAHRAFVEGQEIALTALEFKLLTTFMSRVGRVQTRESLLQDVWGVSSDLQTRTVDTHVKRLREKLGAGRELIETVRGIGYRMVEP